MTTNQLKILLLAVLLSITGIATAQTYTIDGLNYKLKTTNGVTSAQVVGPSENPVGRLTIPSFVTIDGDNYEVTAINARAFENCTELTAVFIPDNVTTIKSAVFKDCTSLISVTLPSAITSLQGLFQGCSSLTDITIPNGV